MRKAALTAIEYFLPDRVLTNADLASEYPEWSIDKIRQKTGIDERHISGPDQCSSDLGVAAAEKLFQSRACAREEIDYLILCTQTPDYFLPSTSCLMQERLKLRTSIGAFDFNLGCSGYVYGLGLAKGLIETGQANTVLLITAETYSKFVHPGDKSVRTLFGDAAAASLLRCVSGDDDTLGPFVYGTDGSGAENLVVRTGGMRNRVTGLALAETDDQGNTRSVDNLYMNGQEIFAFTLNTIPRVVRCLAEKSGVALDEIDLFVFHQANQYMLEHLRKRLKIADESYVISMRHCGNTVSSTIPIALKDACDIGKLRTGAHVMVVGFGVGYSWAASLLRWQ